MEYLIHHVDGKESFLAHYGVKGMHWGVRNAETEAKYRQHKYNTNKTLDRMRSKIDKQSNKLDSAAFKEYKNPHAKKYAKRTRQEATKMTDMQIKYHAKVAKILGNQASDVDKRALHIQKANRNVAAATGAGVAAVGVLGGVAAYNIAKNTKGNKKAFSAREKMIQTNLTNARDAVKRGNEELHWLVKDTKNNGELDIKIKLDTKQNKKQQPSQKPKDHPSEKQINDAATIISTFKEKQRSGQRMTYADYKQLQRDLERVSKSR